MTVVFQKITLIGCIAALFGAFQFREFELEMESLTETERYFSLCTEDAVDVSLVP